MTVPPAVAQPRLQSVAFWVLAWMYSAHLTASSAGREEVSMVRVVVSWGTPGVCLVRGILQIVKLGSFPGEAGRATGGISGTAAALASGLGVDAGCQEERQSEQ